MEERIGLVFSWDPRARHWVKERGPEDAPPPPADPIDNEAVQTYFLDPQTGRWNGTILGLKARQMAVELGNKHRNARMTGLAIIHKAAPKAGVPTPDQPKKAPVPLMAGIAAVVVVIAAGAFASQAMRPAASATVDPAATAVVQPTADVTVAPTDAATPAPTDTAPTPGQTAPPRTPAPTAPPVTQTVTWSAKTATGATLTYNGPNSVNQFGTLSGTLALRTANGAPGSEPVTLYVGPLGTGQTVKLQPDRNGNFSFSFQVTTSKGSYPLAFSVGTNGDLRILGQFVIR